MAKFSRRPRLCEVCRRVYSKRRHLKEAGGRHEEEYVVVGRKKDGVERVICQRNYCREVWRQRGSAIAAKWPEVREQAKADEERWAQLQAAAGNNGDAAPAKPKREAFVERVPPTRELERRGRKDREKYEKAMPWLHDERSAASPTPEPKGQEEMQVLRGDTAKVRRHYYPIEMDRWIAEKLRADGYRIGVPQYIARLILADHPAWVTRTDGTKVSVESIAGRVTTVARALAMPPTKGVAQRLKEDAARTAVAARAFDGSAKVPESPPNQTATNAVAGLKIDELKAAIGEATPAPTAGSRGANAEVILAEMCAKRVHELCDKAAERGLWQELKDIGDLLESAFQ